MKGQNRMFRQFAGMKRIAGIILLLALIVLITAIINPQFISAYNIRNILRWTGLFGLLSLGAAFVVITGGIDLSTGSIVGLIGSIAAYLMVHAGWNFGIVLVFIVALSAALGLVHGLLITRLHIQPFVVTLCGLFIYRGLARFLTNDRTQGYGAAFQEVKFLAGGSIPQAFWAKGSAPRFFQDWSLPMPFLLLVVSAIVLAILLNKTVYGQHLKATGRNERAARFSGIRTDRVIIVAYMICATFGGFGGLLFSLDLNTVQPSSLGNMFELYAIAGCVVGGVSLRGGDGSIVGVILGTAVVRVLYNAINVAGVSTQLEQVVLGMVILIGVAADEVVRTVAARRKVREAMMMAQRTSAEARAKSA